MPNKEKSAEKLEEFFKKTLEEVFRAFSTQCGAKRYLLRLCILMRMCPKDGRYGFLGTIKIYYLSGKRGLLPRAKTAAKQTPGPQANLGNRSPTEKGRPLGRIHLTIHSLKRDLFAPYRVKNARKTSVSIPALFSLSGTKISSSETLRGLQP